MERAMRLQDNQRRDRVESAARFFKRLIPEEQFADGHYIMDVFPDAEADSDLAYRWFTRLLSVWYGQIHDLPIRDDKRVTNVLSVSNFLENNTRRMHRVEMRFPKHKEKAKFTADVIQRLHDISKQERTLESQQMFTRLLVHYFHFIHPLADGNGRAARTAFAMMDPSVDRLHIPPQVLLDKIVERPQDELESFNLIRQRLGDRLLQAHGITPGEERAVDVYEAPLLTPDAKNTLGNTFESQYITFVALHDIMSPEERVQYIHSIDGVPTINILTLPSSLQKLARDIYTPLQNTPNFFRNDDTLSIAVSPYIQDVWAIRAEFTTLVLDAAMDPNDHFDIEYQQHLAEHFSVKA